MRVSIADDGYGNSFVVQVIEDFVSLDIVPDDNDYVSGCMTPEAARALAAVLVNASNELT